jgi:flagellar assembly protein FliH
MENQKILHTEDLNWYEEQENRLDYDLAFDGKGYKKSGKNSDEHQPQESQVDVKQLIEKRNEKWEKRLNKAKEEAYAEGYEQGHEDGYQEAEQQIDEKLGQLEQLIQKSHEDWKKRHKMINPGLLDLVFDMVEKIVGLPVENPEIRNHLEDELSVLLYESEDNLKPQLFVSLRDYEFVEEMVEEYAPELSLSIRVSDDCNPGEFEMETKKETVVYRFSEKLSDLKENLTLPSWK